MKGLHYQVAKILRSEDFSLWQKLNSLVWGNSGEPRECFYLGLKVEWIGFYGESLVSFFTC